MQILVLLKKSCSVITAMFCYYNKPFISQVNADQTNTVQINTRNSSGDEIANVNFLYDDIVHALKIQ